MTSVLENPIVPDYPALYVQNDLVILGELAYKITKEIKLATQLILDSPYA